MSGHPAFETLQTFRRGLGVGLFEGRTECRGTHTALRREWRLEAQRELERACAVAYGNGRRSGRWHGIWLTLVGLGLVAWVGRR